MNSGYVTRKRSLTALTISDELNVYCSVGTWSAMPATDINRGLVQKPQAAFSKFRGQVGL